MGQVAVVIGASGVYRPSCRAATGACRVAGAGFKHIHRVKAGAIGRVWGQLQVHKQLWTLELSVCTCVAAEASHRHMHWCWSVTRVRATFGYLCSYRALSNLCIIM